MHVYFYIFTMIRLSKTAPNKGLVSLAVVNVLCTGGMIDFGRKTIGRLLILNVVDFPTVERGRI